MKCLRNLSRSRYHSRRASTGSFIVRLFTSPVHFSSPGGLVPRAGKKGECWTFLDWRLNSENDSPVHGQPSSRLLGLVSPSVLALRLSPSLITFHASVRYGVAPSVTPLLSALPSCRRPVTRSAHSIPPPLRVERSEWSGRTKE